MACAMGRCDGPPCACSAPNCYLASQCMVAGTLELQPAACTLPSKKCPALPHLGAHSAVRPVQLGQLSPPSWMIVSWLNMELPFFLHYNVFGWRRNAECFVQIVNLLNLDFPAETGTELCVNVLQSLQTLIAGNEANRQRLRADIGYDTLQSGLLKHVPSSGPSQALLEAVLGLILEVCIPAPDFCRRHVLQLHLFTSLVVHLFSVFAIGKGAHFAIIKRQPCRMARTRLFLYM